MPLHKIFIQEYSPEWPKVFEQLKAVYESHLGNLIIEVQHVGSTSVEGLAAKPVIDIDLIIESNQILPEIIKKLGSLGYEYAGDLGIIDREAFRRNSDNVPVDGTNRLWQKHNLYVCPKEGVSLRNHLALRDHLRNNPEKAKEYGDLKKRLALQNPDNIDLYVEGKTLFIVGILKSAGFGMDELSSITEQNRANRV
jgi:GrpB-like predicted nucleotidyltransferase (UPF0157 family)